MNPLKVHNTAAILTDEKVSWEDGSLTCTILMPSARRAAHLLEEFSSLARRYREGSGEEKKKPTLEELADAKINLLSSVSATVSRTDSTAVRTVTLADLPFGVLDSVFDGAVAIIQGNFVLGN